MRDIPALKGSIFFFLFYLSYLAYQLNLIGWNDNAALMQFNSVIRSWSAS